MRSLGNRRCQQPANLNLDFKTFLAIFELRFLKKIEEIIKAIESELLILCSRTRFTPQIQKRINQLLVHDIEWNRFLNNVNRNCLLPLVGWALLTDHKEQLPETVRQRLESYAEQQLKRKLLFTRKLLEVVTTLESQNIPSLQFKGFG